MGCASKRQGLFSPSPKVERMGVSPPQHPPTQKKYVTNPSRRCTDECLFFGGLDFSQPPPNDHSFPPSSQHVSQRNLIS